MNSGGNGHALVEWIAMLISRGSSPSATRRCRPAKPGDLVRALPAEAPEHGEAFERVVD